MILCVNPNAAIDKTVIVRSFRLNKIHRPEQVLLIPGGKGCNVARGLKRLGETPVVAGWVGGFAGQFIQEGLGREGIQTAFVHTDFESRTCLSILDPELNSLTEIYEKGDPVPSAKIAEFVDWFKSNIACYVAVTLSGSLPPGVPMDFFAELLKLSHVAGVPGFLDSSAEALRLGLEGEPYLIKPNQKEFADLLGRQVNTQADFAQAALEISERYRTIVVVSLGAEGALAFHEGRGLHVRPPRWTIKSAVGSGDCMLAGITFGLAHSFPFEQAIRYGVAAGTANALTVGAGIFEKEDFERALANVTIERL